MAGRIVDAVAHHQHAPALPLQLADAFQLLLRREPGVDLANAESIGKRLCGSRSVAGQDGEFQVQCFECAQSAGSIRTNSIAADDRARIDAGVCNVQHRRAGFRGRI